MQNIAQVSSIRTLIRSVGNVVDLLITTLIDVELLVFFWGLAKFVFRLGGDEKAVDEGKRLMIWGTIALFVMISVAGIIGFVQRELGLPDTTFPESPRDIPNMNPFDPRANG